MIDCNVIIFARKFFFDEGDNVDDESVINEHRDTLEAERKDLLLSITDRQGTGKNDPISLILHRYSEFKVTYVN